MVSDEGIKTGNEIAISSFWKKNKYHINYQLEYKLPMYFYFFRVPWTLKIRKEVFSPSETVQSPLAINLIFCQIVTDVFSPLCIRLSSEDRSRMKTLLDEYRYVLVWTFLYWFTIVQTCLDLSFTVSPNLSCPNLSKLV